MYVVIVNGYVDVVEVILKIVVENNIIWELFCICVMGKKFKKMVLMG